jgi:hypothetical protein
LIVYCVQYAVNSSDFVAESGDRFGLTFDNDFGPIALTQRYDESASIYTSLSSTLPTVGASLNFQESETILQFSTAVLINPSKLIACCMLGHVIGNWPERDDYNTFHMLDGRLTPRERGRLFAESWFVLPKRSKCMVALVDGSLESV